MDSIQPTNGVSRDVRLGVLRQRNHPVFSRIPLPSKVPLSVNIATNQVWNRIVVGLLGYELSQIITSRNPYEMLERALHIVSWIGVGIGMPLLLGKFISPAISNQIRRRFKLPKSSVSLLQVPFEWLDAHQLKSRVGKWVALERQQNPKALKTLKSLGLSSFKPLQNQAMVSQILAGKQAILLLDLLVLGSQGQIYAWGKNWLSQVVSGRVGYTGEFNYTSAEYLKQQSQKYETEKDKRKIRSMLVGYGANLALPLLIVGPLLRNAAIKPGVGVLGKAKGMIGLLNYTSAIFMSKSVMFWNDVFNWSFANFSSARDFHEVRERAWEHGSFYFFFYVGDMILSGLGAQQLAKRYKQQGLRVPKLVGYEKLAGLSIPVAVPLGKVFEAVGHQAHHPVYKAARNNFWLGLIGTSAGMALVRLANNLYTRQKVLAQKAPVSQQGLLLRPAVSNPIA